MSMPRAAFVELQARTGRVGGPTFDGLRRAQAEGGELRARDLAAVADGLALPVAEVAGAASYYADFADGPHGRRQVRVCEGTSCFAATGGEHLARVERTLGVRRGQCTGDGSLSLHGVRCLGYCYAAPAALDDDRPRVGADLDGLLRADPAATTAPAPAPEPPPIPYASVVERPVVLAGLAGGAGSWQAWPRVIESGCREQVLVDVAESGLRGRGGAEFPVAAKWKAARSGPTPRYVVGNGDEGDPGSYCDRLLMEQDPHRVLEGLALTGYAVGAELGLLLVRSEYPAALRRMRAAVAEARAAGHLGHRVQGSTVDFDVEILEGAGSYVAGEETALLHAAQGLRGDVSARPPYPTSHGYRNRPTVVQNVETLAAIPWIVQHSGAAYAGLGHPDATGTKLVCLSERFARPGVYEVPFGISLRYLVDEVGGGLRTPHTLRAVQLGGPLGGFLSPADLDVPLLPGALAERGVALGHGSLVAIDTAVPAAELLRHVWSFAAAESCGACTPCRVGARRGLELAAQLGDSARAGAVLAAQEPVLDVMAVGSLCAFGRGVPGTVRSLLRVYPDEFGAPDPTTPVASAAGGT